MSVRIIINVDSLEKVFSGEIRSVKQGFRHGKTDFDVLLTVHFSIILTINQLNAQNLRFIISLFHASTCFEHYVLINTRSKLYYTASGIITPVGGRPVRRLRGDCARKGHL